MAVLFGLLNEADLRSQRVTSVGVDVVDDAIAQSVAEHNRQMDAMLDLFVRRTTEYSGRFMAAANHRLQPLDSMGRARPVKPAGYYDLAWPIQMGGTAWGYDWVTGEKLTVGEVGRMTASMLDADFRWMRDHLLAALFVDGSWTFEDPLKGSLTVYGPASGDSTAYNLRTGADSGATDDHLLFDDTPDADTFTTIYDELLEHPENDGEVIAFIPTNLKSTVEGITTFYPIEDPDLRPGMSSTVLQGRLGRNVPGTVLGKVEKVWVVEWRSLPDDYIIGITTEGERPLALREDEEASLRGFKQVAQRDDHPWYERQYARRAGFGAWNRVGSIVVKDAAAYAVPTNYGSPMG
jgi:hypothetical protein